MKYIVTDPCYLLQIIKNDEKRDDIWSKFCDILNRDPICIGPDDYEDAQEYLKQALGLDFLEIASTGYGDWSNHLTLISNSCNPFVDTNTEFCADAGLVCVANYIPEMECEYEHGSKFNSDTVPAVNFNDDNKNWTVVEIGGTLNGKSYQLISDDEDEE